jgi:hypothetical protein
MSFTFGADPEFIVVNNDEFKSAIGVLSRKENATLKNKNKYYFDNVLAEIAILPGKNKSEVLSNFKTALHDLAKLIKPNKFIIKASGHYPKKELACPEAKIAGCNAEWSVYSLQEVYPPDEDVEMMDGYYQFKTSFRSAGGHIHLGSENLLDSMVNHNVIRMMDLFLGIPSIFLDTDETSRSRRKIYGHAGSHRQPDHGLEYRTLGNFWFSSPELVSLIYDLSEFSLEFVDKKYHERFWSVNEDLLDEEDPSVAYTCFGYDVNSLRKAIDTCNKKTAEKFMMFIGNYLPASLMSEIDRLSGQPLQDPYESWAINV